MRCDDLSHLIFYKAIKPTLLTDHTRHWKMHWTAELPVRLHRPTSNASSTTLAISNAAEEKPSERISAYLLRV